MDKKLKTAKVSRTKFRQEIISRETVKHFRKGEYMRNTEKLVFGCFEVSSYVLIGLAIWQKSPLLGVIGAFVATITVVWFLRLAKRIGIINPFRRRG